MMKKQEKIIISKQLAIDLIWWLEHASAPCMTIGEVHEHWHLFKDEQMTLARDAMKDELEKALVANVEVAYEPVNLFTNIGNMVVLTVEEAKLIQTLAKMPLIIWDTKTQKAMTQLQKRIEQAETKNE